MPVPVVLALEFAPASVSERQRSNMLSLASCASAQPAVRR